ncbi:ATP-binding protein [Methanorbis rubei]|uniref:Schlafen AlbA-2 domain-containing protein n=1 Tax=Methanorbis rubei TaxID=3028300 RepID=A0AAE4MEX2_9EURY|nr:hypothetical protein [Methanocorpusculaceae archaeon Cs1]
MGYIRDTDIQQLFEELNTLDEHTRIEAKSVTNQLGESIKETISAFSNEPGLGGGYILLGVSHQNDPEKPAYYPSGVNEPDKLQNDLNSLCANIFSSQIRPQVATTIIDGKVVIDVFIEEAPDGLKPISFEKKIGGKSHPKIITAAYRRNASGDILCTDTDTAYLYTLRKMRPYDETIISGTSFADIEPHAISEYRRLRAKRKPNASELQLNDSDLLDALHCTKIVDGVVRPTVSGLILFGTEKALKKYFPMTRLDYLRVKGREWGEEMSEYYTLELREGLMTLLPKAEVAIMDDMIREFSFPSGSLTRSEQTPIPYEAIREVLVNTVMHRDYEVSGPTLVIRFADRIEFHNPGYSLKSLDKIGTPGSKTRNPNIADVLHETEYAENKGTGIAKIRDFMKKANQDPPVFQSDRFENTFSAILYLHQLMDEDAMKWLEHFKDANLSSEESRILVYAKKYDYVSNEICRDITGHDTLKASNILKKLREKGLLVQHSHGSATYYTLPQRHLDNNTDFSLSPQLSPQRIQLQVDNNADFGLSPQLLPQRIQLLGEDGDSERQQLFRTLPESLREEIFNLGQRITPEKKEELILKICSSRSETTAAELSIIFGKTRDWAKKSLKPLVTIGKVAQTVPDKPNSINQAYYVPKTDGQRFITEKW